MYVASSVRANRKMGFQGYREMQHKQQFLKLSFPVEEFKLYEKVLRS